MAYSDSREELATCGGSNIVKVWNEFTKQTKYLLHGELPEEIVMVCVHIYIYIYIHSCKHLHVCMYKIHCDYY